MDIVFLFVSLLLNLRLVHFFYQKKSIYSHFMILFFETLNYCLWSIERDLFRWKDFSPSKALFSLVIFVSSFHLSFLMYFEKCIIFNQRIHLASKRFNNKIYTLNSREIEKKEKYCTDSNLYVLVWLSSVMIWPIILQMTLQWASSCLAMGTFSRSNSFCIKPERKTKISEKKTSTHLTMNGQNMWLKMQRLKWLEH